MVPEVLKLEMIRSLQEMNPNVKIHDVGEKGFSRYGRILSYDARAVIDHLAKEEAVFSKLPKARYVTDRADLHDFPLFSTIQKEIYGELAIQVGVVQGRNQYATGTEFHQGSEVNIAVTDCLLVLGDRAVLVANGSVDISQMEVYFVKKGTLLEIYDSTLHYTPIETDANGFSLVVVLIEGTNTDIDAEAGSMLTKKNKWYVCHASQTQKIEQGAVAGLTGALLKIEHA